MYSCYFKWLFDQRQRTDDVGRLAMDAFMDVTWNGHMKDLCKIIKADYSDATLATYDKSVHEFKDQRKAYYVPKANLKATRSGDTDSE
jgi:uncharacterized protein YozE (UPF0346 family)